MLVVFMRASRIIAARAISAVRSTEPTFRRQSCEAGSLCARVDVARCQVTVEENLLARCVAKLTT
jgi:hypothetical protein